jgi:hypothetical protein
MRSALTSKSADGAAWRGFPPGAVATHLRRLRPLGGAGGGELRQRWLIHGGAMVVSLVVAAGVVERPRDTLVLAAALGAMVLAATRPAWFGAGLVVSLLFPYVWSPNVVGGPTPVVVLIAYPGALVAGVVLLSSGRLRANWFDALVIGLAVSAFVSESMTSHGHRYTVELLKAGVLPYAAFRLVFAAWPSAMSKLPEALLWVGVAASALAAWEVVAGGNPFLHGPVNPALARWAVNIHRGGLIRAAATFGHPIALGSFLVVPIVIAFARRRWRMLAVLAVGELLTLSRGPWIAAILAVLLYAILTKGFQRVWVLVVVLSVVGLFVGPVRNVVSASFQSGTVEQANAAYRTQLIGSTLGSLTVWGDPTPDTVPSYLLSQLRPTDMTSEPALIASKQGVGGLVLWLGLLAALVAATATALRRRDYLLLSLAVAALGVWTAMLSVALITTLAATFWLVVACVATLWSADRAADPGSTGPRRAVRSR